MKKPSILYAFQGTGNGHLARACEIVPILQQFGKVDVLMSGIQSDLSLPFPLAYRLKGLSFIFGKKGGVDLWRTFLKSNLRRLRKEILHLPVADYDLVINDFEPVSAWACYLRQKTCVGLSHQSAVIDPAAPTVEVADPIGKLILSHYAPVSVNYGFHFQSYSDRIYTPVIRKMVRKQPISDLGHYTVYLPAYSDKRLLKMLSELPDINWQVFSKHNHEAFSKGNVSIQPINHEQFTASMASSTGVLCGAGFETPAETLFLGKKLMVIPMKNQLEQHLNAGALDLMGVPSIKKLKPEYLSDIRSWIDSNDRVKVNYPDNTANLISKIVSEHVLS